MLQLQTVISGSYRKHLREIIELKHFLELQGIRVLAPACGDVVNIGEEFVVLQSDPIDDHRILQDSIFAKMRQASFHVLLNKEGYIGRAATFELGYAAALGLQILTLEPVADPNLEPYTRLLTKVFPSFSLPETQERNIQGSVRY